MPPASPTPPPPPLDPRVRRFALLSGDNLTVQDVVEVLGEPFKKRTVERLMANGMITTASVRNAAGRGKKIRRSTSRGALLHFIITSTDGPLEVVLAAIAQDAPRWLPFARQVAKAPASPLAELPANVVPISSGRKPRVPQDPYQGHPDLFTSAAS